jgi:NAD(P)-dependent dehydrogenase (short-subunit alcohol dehydrogenase family)
LIHNAGTLDPLGEITLHNTNNEADAAESLFREAQASSAVNISSFVALTAAFVAFANKSSSRPLPHERKPSLVVDISSLAATQPFPSWGMYCANKASRAMVMRTLSSEAKLRSGSADELHVLSYSPGPLDTDMQREIRQSSRVDETVRAEFRQMHDAGALVDPRVSAAALAALIELGPSRISELGGAVDYYDLQTS